tara:strand:- start:153 stop:680 length:528 start_codon:yes stop_codon:yes gene_type:complete
MNNSIDNNWNYNNDNNWNDNNWNDTNWNDDNFNYNGIFLILIIIVCIIINIICKKPRIMRRRGEGENTIYNNIGIVTENNNEDNNENNNNENNLDNNNLSNNNDNEGNEIDLNYINFNDIDDKIDNIDCSICLELFNNEDKLIKLTCGHIYHELCIEGWFNIQKVCPNCRKDINI